MTTWTNEDGLRVKFGPSETEKARVTEVANGADKRVIEIAVDAEHLPAVADNSVIIDDSYVIPKGVVFESVTITVNKAFTAGAGTLNVGITDHDGEDDDVTDVDFFVAAATVAELNAGGKDDSGWVGSGPFGTPLAEAAYLTWEVDTAAIVGGSATIRIEMSIPKTNVDTLVPNKPYSV